MGILVSCLMGWHNYRYLETGEWTMFGLHAVPLKHDLCVDCHKRRPLPKWQRKVNRELKKHTKGVRP